MDLVSTSKAVANEINKLTSDHAKLQRQITTKETTLNDLQRKSKHVRSSNSPKIIKENLAKLQSWMKQSFSGIEKYIDAIVNEFTEDVQPFIAYLLHRVVFQKTLSRNPQASTGHNQQMWQQRQQMDKAMMQERCHR